MRSTHLGLVLLTLLAVSLPSILAPAQDAAVAPNDQARARSAFEAGRDAYERGRFAEALSLWERAYALSGRAELLFDIGRAAEADGQNERAIAAYDQYLRELPDVDNRDFVLARQERLRATLTPPPAATAAPTVPASAAVPAAPPAALAPPVAPAPSAPTAPTVHRVAAPVPEAPPPRTPSRADVSMPPPLVQGPAWVGGPAPMTPPAEAQRPPALPRRFQLWGGVRIGGRGTQHRDNAINPREGPSTGLQLGAGGVWRFFGLGAELRLDWLRLKAPGLSEHVRAFEVMVKPRVGYKFTAVPLELYATTPLGARVAAGSDRPTGVLIGLLAGVSYFFKPHLGVNVESGAEIEGGGMHVRERTVWRFNGVVGF